MGLADAALLALALSSSGCDLDDSGTGVELTIRARSQGDIEGLSYRLWTVEGSAPRMIGTRTVERTVAELTADPIELRFSPLARTSYVLHLVGTSPMGETFVATRCYELTDSLIDTVVLSGPLGVLDGDGCETGTQTSLAHCGGCGRPCDPAHATGVCTGGSCRVASCDTNWGDCNGFAGDGCEGNLRSLVHCGSCGSGCSIANASETCATGSCRIATCNFGWGDCDSDGRSCETRLNTVLDCGSCGTVCAIPNATETCSTGSCRVSSCNPGWGDCDMNMTSCETPLNTTSNCGGCGVVCSGGTPLCCMGSCSPACA